MRGLLHRRHSLSFFVLLMKEHSGGKKSLKVYRRVSCVALGLHNLGVCVMFSTVSTLAVNCRAYIIYFA